MRGGVDLRTTRASGRGLLTAGCRTRTSTSTVLEQPKLAKHTKATAAFAAAWPTTTAVVIDHTAVIVARAAGGSRGATARRSRVAAAAAMTPQMPVTHGAFFVAVRIPGIHAPATAVILLVALKLPSGRCHELPWMAGFTSIKRRARNVVLERYVSPS